MAYTQQVSMRDIWPNETLDFTPWLAENLHLLGEAIGMELSLIQTEAPGWAGSLDILAEANGKGKVAIENQIEPSDNDHFARLIGYAADCDADILVWVTRRFLEYHQRQLGWLKEAMDGRKEIYAVVASLAPDGDLRPVNSHPDALGFHAVFSSIDLAQQLAQGPGSHTRGASEFAAKAAGVFPAASTRLARATDLRTGWLQLSRSKPIIRLRLPRHCIQCRF